MSPFTSNGPTDGENGTATPSKRFQYTCLGAVRGTLWSLLSGVHARALAELVADAAGFVAAAEDCRALCAMSGWCCGDPQT